jgi:hypothetical protein
MAGGNNQLLFIVSTLTAELRGGAGRAFSFSLRAATRTAEATISGTAMPAAKAY